MSISPIKLSNPLPPLKPTNPSNPLPSLPPEIKVVPTILSSEASLQGRITLLPQNLSKTPHPLLGYDPYNIIPPVQKEACLVPPPFDSSEEFISLHLFLFLQNHNLAKNPTIFIKFSKKIPQIIHTIWMGKPISGEFLENIRNWKTHNPEFHPILWCNKTAINDDITTFCRENGIVLFDIFEVFSGDRTLSLEPFIRFNIDFLIKNYGKASDVLRYIILYWIGGLYSDQENTCGPNGNLSNFEVYCNQAQQSSGVLWHDTNNDFFATISGHPLFYNLFSFIKGHTEAPTDTLFHDMLSVHNNIDPFAKATLLQTGPYFLRTMIPSLALRLRPLKTSIKSRCAGTWHHSRKSRPLPNVLPNIENEKFLSTYLLRQLQETPDFLDLTQVEPYLSDDRLKTILAILQENFPKAFERVNYLATSSSSLYEALSPTLPALNPPAEQFMTFRTLFPDLEDPLKKNLLTVLFTDPKFELTKKTDSINNPFTLFDHLDYCYWASAFDKYLKFETQTQNYKKTEFLTAFKQGLNETLVNLDYLQHFRSLSKLILNHLSSDFKDYEKESVQMSVEDAEQQSAQKAEEIHRLEELKS